jgi:hypothetical protein
MGLTRTGKEREVALNAEAAQDKDAELRLLPPLHSTWEAHSFFCSLPMLASRREGA